MRNFKERFLFLVLVYVIFTLSIPLQADASALKEGERYTLTVLHTNDIHGHVDNLPEYATIIKDTKKDTGLNLLVLDGGDIFLRGEFQPFQGLAEMEMLNAIGYDAMVYGNNDFRVPPSGGTPDDGNNQLKALDDAANFPILCANVKMKNGNQYMDFAKPYIVKEVDGVKVGIIGITSMKPQMRNWTEVSDKTFESGEIALKPLLEEVSREADVTLLLSHAGIVVDTYMLAPKGIAAIFGADDHIVIRDPIYYAGNDGEKEIPLVQNGGEFEHYLGRLDLTFEKVGGVMKLVDYDRELYSLEGVEEDAEIRNIIDKYRQKALEPAA